MADNKQLQQQVQEASWGMLDSLRESTQEVANSLVSLQDHNARFAQNVFLSWTDLLRQQTERRQLIDVTEDKLQHEREQAWKASQ